MTTLHVQPLPDQTFSCEVYTNGNYIRWQALRATCLEHAEAEAVELFAQYKPTSVNEIMLVPVAGEEGYAGLVG